MGPALPRPEPTASPDMAPGRANPAAPASSQPVVAQPPGTMNNTATPAVPPNTGGLAQPGLAPSQPMGKTASAAMRRAEVCSLFYKFGMLIKRDKR